MWCKELTHLKRRWCWERLKAVEEGDSKGWDGWMASPAQWTWVWVNSRSVLWTGRQRVRHDWSDLAAAGEPHKGPSSQSYGFSSGHVWMWELVYKESWVPKNWCFWIVVLVNTESSLDFKPVNPQGKQSWILIRRIDAEAEAPILWPPDEKNWLTGKDPDAGKDGRREKGMTEDEMVEWHHRLNEHEFE